MNNFEEVKLFGTTSLSDIFEQIHSNNKKVDTQIDDLVNNLKPLIKSAGEVVMIMPTVKDLLEVNVKNNDQLVKIAGIAQRTMNANASQDLFDMSEVEDLMKQHELNTAESTKLITDGEQLKIETAK